MPVQIPDVHYLFAGHAACAAHIAAYHQDPNIQHLVKAMDVLCDTLETLEAHADLWKAIRALVDQYPDNKQEVDGFLANTDGFIESEFAALMAITNNAAQAAGLVAAARSAVAVARVGFVTSADIDRVTEGLGGIKDHVCGIYDELSLLVEPTPGAPEHAGFFVRVTHGLHAVAVGLTYVAGAALAAADVVAVPLGLGITVPIAIGSAGTGVAAMKVAMEQSRQD